MDALALEDDRLALLVEHAARTPRVIVLDGIAPTIWAATAQPATLRTIVDSTVATHGEPADGDAATLVTASLSQLTAEGLIQLDAL